MVQTEEERKDKRVEYRRTYINKPKSKELRRKLEVIKITCECGAVIRKYGVSQHLQTKKHINKLQLLNESFKIQLLNERVKIQLLNECVKTELLNKCIVCDKTE